MDLLLSGKRGVTDNYMFAIMDQGNNERIKLLTKVKKELITFITFVVYLIIMKA